MVLQAILQGRPAKHGTNPVGQYLILAINVFMYTRNHQSSTLNRKHPQP